MNIRKSLIIVLAATTAFSQPVPSTRTRILLQNYDLTAVGSGNATSCQVSEEPIRVRITTSGSSTTTTALTTGTIPFAKAAVGDMIRAFVPNTNPAIPPVEVLKVIATKASSDSITVNSAWTLSTLGTDFTLIKDQCSVITNSTPWEYVTSNSLTTLNFNTTTMNATGGISFRIEGLFSDVNDVNPIVVNMWPGVIAADAKCPGGTFDGVANCNYAAAFSGVSFSTTANFKPQAVRLVAFIVTADTGVQAINASLTVTK